MSVSGAGRIAVLQVEPQYHGTPDITKSQEVDTKRMKSTMRILAKASGMRLHITKLTGNNASEEKIATWIEAQRKHPPTVAVLDCNGHGKRDWTSRWPRFTLSEGKRVSSSQLMDAFEKIPAGLTVSHIEACNSDNFLHDSPSLIRAEDKGFAFRRKLHNESKKIQKKAQHEKATKVGSKVLFKGVRGHVRIASASPGQRSYSSDTIGGVSTLLVEKALIKECSHGKKAGWKDIEKKFRSVKKLHVSPTPLVSVKVKKVHTHMKKH